MYWRVAEAATDVKVVVEAMVPALEFVAVSSAVSWNPHARLELLEVV